MRLLIDFIVGFLMLGVTEAVIKPIAKRFIRRKILKYAPVAMDVLDKQLPRLLGTYSGKELEQIVSYKLEELTGEPWDKAELDQIFGLFDVRITADRTRDA
jgi:hypothetical protein